MKRILWFTAAVLIGLYGCKRSPPPVRFLRNMVVILDPGHGGTDPGAGWQETFVSREGVKVVKYWEASYTYRMASELADMLRSYGATVFLTEISDRVMAGEWPDGAQDSVPLPRDAYFSLDGQPSKPGKVGLAKRAEYANQIAKKYPKRLVVFLSLHIDSMPHGWQGAHVLIDKTQLVVPEIATILKRRIREQGYARKHLSEEVRVLDVKDLCVLRKCQIPERALIELSTPVSKSDSWRLRSFRHRRELLRLIRRSLVELAKNRST